MTKIRIYDLAKQIERESKEIIAALKEQGVEGKTASSSITEEQVELVKSKLLAGVKKAEKSVSEKVQKGEDAVKKAGKKAEKAVKNIEKNVEKNIEKAAAEVKKRVEERQSQGGREHEENVLAHASIQKGEKSKYVTEAMNYIMEHYADSDIGVRKIAESLGLSEGHLSHTFKKETEYTINAYITRYRVRVAMKLLQNCRYKVYEVAEMVGYKDITYFSTIFKKIAGVTPSEYQDRIGGETE